MPKLTIEELIAKLPDQLKPFAAQYGPALLTLTADELKAVLALLLAGDIEAPYRAALAAMTPDQREAETIQFTSQDGLHVSENAAKVAEQKKIAQTIVGILLSIILGAVGF
jgi:hypothetical protein